MYNSIILYVNLFGSFYLFSKSLELTNRSFLENKKMPLNLILMNGFTFVLSGSIITYSLVSFGRLIKDLKSEL